MQFNFSEILKTSRYCPRTSFNKNHEIIVFFMNFNSANVLKT